MKKEEYELGEANIVEVEPKEVSNTPKMNILEYQERYSKQENGKLARQLIGLFSSLSGVIIFACLFMISAKAFDYHLYAGIAVSLVSLVVFILVFIVPITRILKSEHFVVDVDRRNYKEAIRHNKKARRNISSKIVEITSKCEDNGWYDLNEVSRLAESLEKEDDEGIKSGLTALYKGSVKRAAKNMISKCAVKAGTFSALSQDSRLDAALVATVNVQMIKDLVYLYGFRPSDAKLARIVGNVFRNSLLAYGLGGIKIGNSVAKTMGDIVENIPLLGSVISMAIDSTVSGLSNGVLTAMLGYKTISYLNKDYKLQDILDGVDVSASESEFEETCKEVKSSMSHKAAKAKKAAA